MDDITPIDDDLSVSSTDAGVPLPVLPDHIRITLNATEQRLAVELIDVSLDDQKELAKALLRAGYKRNRPQFAFLRDSPLPIPLYKAVIWLKEKKLNELGKDKVWIGAQMVQLYERSSAPKMTLIGPKGESIQRGVADGPTALGALKLLGQEVGMFKSTTIHDVPQDVKQLMSAIAARGKPSLEDRSKDITAEVQVIDNGASQQ